MSIYSRLPKSIRQRDWMAAIIDIVVVVIGILMALALDDWYTKREADAERLELLRLAYAEVRDNEETMISWTRHLQEELDSMEEILIAIADPHGPGTLSQEQCEAVYTSNVVPISTWILPTVERLVTTQQLNSREDSAVRSAAQEFINAQSYQRDDELRVSAGAVSITDTYAGLISVSLSNEKEARGEFVDAKAVRYDCDLPAMREHAEFLDALILNYRALAILTNGAIRLVKNRFNTLRLALYKRLGEPEP